MINYVCSKHSVHNDSGKLSVTFCDPVENVVTHLFKKRVSMDLHEKDAEYHHGFLIRFSLMLPSGVLVLTYIHIYTVHMSSS